MSVCVFALQKESGLGCQRQASYTYSPWQLLAVLRKWDAKVKVTWLWKRSWLPEVCSCNCVLLLLPTWDCTSY